MGLKPIVPEYSPPPGRRIARGDFSIALFLVLGVLAGVFGCWMLLGLIFLPLMRSDWDPPVWLYYLIGLPVCAALFGLSFLAVNSARRRMRARRLY
jgi:hypothetical protein